ncbi:MAG: hypothetical protein HUJ51_03790 [Eggerthellaceae bacterium]|nr:hypothetical protein [Eggerthellaceae bacterium]
MTFPIAFCAMSSASWGDARHGSVFGSEQQLAFIVANPLAYAKTLYHILKDYFELPKRPMLFNDFGYLGTPAFNGSFAVFSLVLFAALADTNKCSLLLMHPFIILFVLVIFAVLVTLIPTTLYLSFCLFGFMKFLQSVAPFVSYSALYARLSLNLPLLNNFSPLIYNCLLLAYSCILLLINTFVYLTSNLTICYRFLNCTLKLVEITVFYNVK